ncbi:MAG TPA: 4Fe-4S binding protein [Sedimenticola sp.]|nr:4Fe-4S binding protein [Sedimenticola sp.]
MNELVQDLAPAGRRRPPLQTLGDWMRRQRSAIQALQWTVVVFYLALLIWPALLPLPREYAHFYENLVLFAQFVFWGLWWPFVILSMLLLGRVWCGVFCPEGALSEWASRHGRGGAIPRWMRWGGWPFTAFVLTTVYGQLISVYEYPRAALLILGGSTIVAMAVGFFYGRGKRVWCRHLCPVNGVFSLLARLAPVHFRVDAAAWRRAPRRTPAVDCAPLVNISGMTGASACHMCGRCSGHRNAVTLSARSPNREILSLGDNAASRWDALLLTVGLLGVATGAFQWSASPWFVQLKQGLAEWLIERDIYWPLGDGAPWWLLTHYPETNDVFTWLDGGVILLYIGATTLVIGGALLLALRLAGRLLGQRTMPWRLAYGLTPLAGISLFLGLSALTLSLLKAERLDLSWAPGLRAALLAVAVLWTGRLLWGLLGAGGNGAVFRRRALAWLCLMAAAGLVVGSWVAMFYYW